MKDSKFLNLLETISKQDLTQLKKWVKMHDERNYYGLFLELLKHRRNGTIENDCRKKIYKNVFWGSQYNDNVWRVMVSGLTKITEDFIIFKTLSNNPENKNRLLNDYFLDVGQLKLFNGNYKKMVRQFDNYVKRNNEFYFHAYQGEIQHIKYLNSTKREFYDIKKKS